MSARVRQETTASSAQAVADAGTGAGASFCGERFLRGEITGSCGELDERKVSAGMSCPRQIESTVALAEEVRVLTACLRARFPSHSLCQSRKWLNWSLRAAASRDVLCEPLRKFKMCEMRL